MTVETATLGDARAALLELVRVTARLAGACAAIVGDGDRPGLTDAIARALDEVAPHANNAESTLVREWADLLPTLVGALREASASVEVAGRFVVDDLGPLLQQVVDGLPRPA